jgi:2-polyprenyl-3-methyl-5-hydroxy-6-metoxy-1,4-benzoquinol methylase
MNISFAKYAKYYDQIYADKSYAIESQYISKILKKKKLKILEIGCGSGGHALQLHKMGHKITAIDSSKQMISAAKKKSKKINFLVKDGLYYRSKKKFDAIILLFHVINFFKNFKELESFFINCSYNLKLEGILICDFININALKKHPPIKKIKTVAIKNKISLVRKTFPSFNKTTNIFTIRFRILIYKLKLLIDNFLEIHRLRIHSIDELKKSYGNYFKKPKIYKWLTLEKLKKNIDWNATLVIKKK